MLITTPVILYRIRIELDGSQGIYFPLPDNHTDCPSRSRKRGWFQQPECGAKIQHRQCGRAFGYSPIFGDVYGFTGINSAGTFTAEQYYDCNVTADAEL